MARTELKYTKDTFESLPENYAGPYRIPYGIKTIADEAFSGCHLLTSVDIPDSVTSIGKHAFQWCFKLESITIPDSVTSIGESAFWSCSSLESITIPDRVTSIGESAFWSCSSLGSITIPDRVTSIGKQAFLWCLKLESITIPDRVTSIGEEAFDGTGFSEDEIKQIYDYVNNLSEKETSKTFTHSEVVTCSIPNNIVNNRENNEADESSAPSSDYRHNKKNGETQVLIPNTYSSIGYNAFDGCTELISIEIPTNVTNIFYNAFGGCAGLTSIEIPSSVTSIDDYAFARCSGLSFIEIPPSVEIIGRKAFNHCSRLEKAAVLGKVTTIEWPLFTCCPNLKKLIVKSSYYVVDDGLVYNRARTELYEFIPSLCHTDSIIIDRNVKVIHSGAFSDLKSVKSIELPKYLRRIESEAFDFASSEMILILNTDNAEQIIVKGYFYEEDALGDINENCSLIVPIGTRYAYSHHPVWGKFKNITTAPIDWGDD